MGIELTRRNFVAGGIATMAAGGIGMCVPQGADA